MRHRFDPTHTSGSGYRTGWVTDPHLRVSDAERNEVAERLSRHFADGRLDQSEFGARLDRATRAKTRGDLAGLFDDLPRLADEPSPPRAGVAGGSCRSSWWWRWWPWRRLHPVAGPRSVAPAGRGRAVPLAPAGPHRRPPRARPTQVDSIGRDGHGSDRTDPDGPTGSIRVVYAAVRDSTAGTGRHGQGPTPSTHPADRRRLHPQTPAAPAKESSP